MRSSTSVAAFTAKSCVRAGNTISDTARPTTHPTATSMTRSNAAAIGPVCVMVGPKKTMTAVNGREVFATWSRTRWLLEHGVVDLRPLITSRYGLGEFERAFAELRSGQACKISLDPGVLAAAGATEHAVEVPA